MEDEKELAEPIKGAKEIMESISIVLSKGTTKARVEHFPALVGWEIRRMYQEYLESRDSNFRVNFTLQVLSHSYVTVDGEEIKMDNFDAINKNLETWENIEILFYSVLGYNGIKQDADKIESTHWQQAGKRLALGFMSSMGDLITPAVTIAANKANSNQDGAN